MEDRVLGEATSSATESWTASKERRRIKLREGKKRRTARGNERAMDHPIDGASARVRFRLGDMGRSSASAATGGIGKGRI